MTASPDARAASGVFSPPGPQGAKRPRTAGQRYAEDKSGSDLSDKYPAGPDRTDAVGAKMGRVTLDTSIDVRFTSAERAAVDRRVRTLGVKRSSWVRDTVLDALDSRRDRVGDLEAAAAVPAPLPEVAEAVEQLRRVGVLLNQERRHQRRFEDDLLGETITRVDELRARLGDRTAL